MYLESSKGLGALKFYSQTLIHKTAKKTIPSANFSKWTEHKYLAKDLGAYTSYRIFGLKKPVAWLS